LTTVVRVGGNAADAEAVGRPLKFVAPGWIHAPTISGLCQLRNLYLCSATHIVLPFREFPNFRLQRASLHADLRKDGYRLFEVRHRFVGAIRRVQQIGQMIV